MKTTTKAFLIGLLVAAAGPALAQTTTTSFTESAPKGILGATVTTGSASFSGLGTGQMRTQEGSTQALNVGMTTSLSAATSAESTPDYASSGSVSTVAAADSKWEQSFGITSVLGNDTTTSTTGTGATTTTSTATTGTIDDQTTGSFVGSFDTKNDVALGTSKSDVSLSGVSSDSMVGIATSAIDLSTSSRAPETAGTDNASGSASGNISASTSASASISSSTFESGFIQTFAPTHVDGTTLAGIEDVSVTIVED